MSGTSQPCVKAKVYATGAGKYLGIVLFPCEGGVANAPAYLPGEQHVARIDLSMKMDLRAEKGHFNTFPINSKPKPGAPEEHNITYIIPAERALPVMQWLRNGGVEIAFENGLKETDLGGKVAKLPAEHAGTYFSQLTADPLARQDLKLG